MEKISFQESNLSIPSPNNHKRQLGSSPHTMSTFASCSSPNSRHSGGDSGARKS